MNVIYEKEINIPDIIVSPRPLWKCRSCPSFKKSPSCPEFTPGWREAREWVSYFDNCTVLKYSLSMKDFENEKRAILNDLLAREREHCVKNPYSMALFPGSCNLCEKCTFPEKCEHPEKVRPSLDAVGIELPSVAEVNFHEEVLWGIIFY